MFSIGDLVVYGADGVCRISDVKTMDLTGTPALYYLLQPESERSSTIYVPAENSELANRIKPLLTENEIYEIVNDTDDGEPVWVDSTNQRKLRYQEIINSGDRRRLVRLIRELHGRYSALRGKGLRFSLTDEHYYKLAKRVIFDEFSRVIKVTESECLQFIMKTTE